MFANLAGMFAKLANIKIAQQSENKGKNGNWMFAIGKHGKKSWQTWQKNKQKRDVDDGKHTLWNNAKTSLVYTHHPCGLG